MKYCSKCGQKVHDEAVVCPYYDGETIDDLIKFCDYTIQEEKTELNNCDIIVLNNALSA